MSKEYILCAAIWYKKQPTAMHLPKNIKYGVVVCGRRHHNCMYTFLALTGKASLEAVCGEFENGFITSTNRFVNRKKAVKVALAANQITESKDLLFSEDLY